MVSVCGKELDMGRLHLKRNVDSHSYLAGKHTADQSPIAKELLDNMQSIQDSS